MNTTVQFVATKTLYIWRCAACGVVFKKRKQSVHNAMDSRAALDAAAEMLQLAEEHECGRSQKPTEG